MRPYSYRGDPALARLADGHPIIVFDGHCACCAPDAASQERFLG